MKKILVIGAFGQIGSDLVPALQKKYGKSNVVAVGHNQSPKNYQGIFELAEITDLKQIEEIIKKYSIGEVYHLASVLTSYDPDDTWNINVNGLINILKLAREYKFRLFWPSSVAVFGPTTPQENTPQSSIMEPETMYGITKVAGELLCQYYYRTYGVDVRTIRYPRIISWKSNPTKSGSDYMVNVFFAAIKDDKFVMPVSLKTAAPIIYIDDVVSSILKIMSVDPKRLSTRMGYNISVISCTAEEIS